MPDPTLPTPSLGRQPALDGIRGIAILAVLFFHFEWPWLPGGFLGVDVFFTLSGFLITTLLLEEQFATGRISLPHFFARRGIRLYPALVALVAVSTVFSLLFHRETGTRRTLEIAAGVLGYVANWQTMVDSSGWFGGMPHTWSLAIEAHFYVLWAGLVFLIARRFGAAADRTKLLKILLVLALGIAAASAGWRAVLWSQDARWLRMYLGTDTRLDAVFLGTMAALFRLLLLSGAEAGWLKSSGRGTISIVETVCAAGLAWLLALTKWQTALPGMLAFSLASGATAVLILTTTLRSDSLFGTVFRTPILTWFGRISYSLYIWHVPAAKFVKADRLRAMGFPSFAAEAARLGVTIVIAVISYYAIERTFLRLKHRFEPRVSAVPGTGRGKPAPVSP